MRLGKSINASERLQLLEMTGKHLYLGCHLPEN